MFINQLFLVYLIGFHALKGFFPDFAMKLILASLAKWIKKHCQWESRIETSWNCLDRETEDALEKILAYIKTNVLLQQQSSTLSHVKLVDIGRKGKTWVKADSPCPELSSEMPGEPTADLTSVQMPEVCKGLQGGSPVWGGGGNAVPYHLQIPPVWPPSRFSDKEAEQLWSQSCNSYLHTWMAHVHRSQPRGSCQCIGGSFTKFLLQSKDTNSKVKVISVDFTFWKVHIQNPIHSLTLKHTFDTHACARWVKSLRLHGSVEKN